MQGGRRDGPSPLPPTTIRGDPNPNAREFPCDIARGAEKLLNADRPLSGLRVVDTTDRTGMSAARLLADWGADVVRVDVAARPLDPFTASRNANKRSVVFQGTGHLRALLDHADVWFDSGRGELDTRAVHQELPDLVTVRLSPFGSTGPYRDLAATHPVVYALSGQLKLCRQPGREPLLPPGEPAFEVAGAMAAYLALVAIWNRSSIGTGDHIDVSIHEAYIQTIDTAMAGASLQDLVPASADRPRAGHPAFPTADGMVRPLVVSAHQWRALRDWLGDPPYLRGDELASYGGRLLHPEVLARAYGPLFADAETEPICEEAQRRNVPTAPVMSPAQLLASAPMARRGTFAETTVEGRSGRLPAGYWMLEDDRVGFGRAAPVSGADTDEVVTSLDRGEPPFATERYAVPSTAGTGGAPLAGLRVLEFTQLMAGPEAGRLLRDHGADVIKVESRAFPDQSRVFGGAAMLSSQFVTINRDKRSFGVDLRQASGLSLVLQLVARSDIVIENLGPGVMDGLGLGFDALRRANPDVVVVSSQLLGDSGPWGWWRGFGSHARSLGGQTWLWRYPETERAFGEDAIFFPDQFVGRLEAIAALACVRTPNPGHVRVSQADAVINSLSELILQESLNPGSVSPLGNRCPDAAPWGLYRCAGEDDWCVVTVRDDDDWSRLVDMLGNPDWAADGRYATTAGRLAAVDEIDEHLSGWTRSLPAREVMDRLQGARVPAATVLAPVDLLSDPHLLDRDFVQVISQPGFDSVLVEGDAHHAEHLPSKPPGAAPRQGEHTAEIAREVLGLSTEEVERLFASGVLEDAGGQV